MPSHRDAELVRVTVTGSYGSTVDFMESYPFLFDVKSAPSIPLFIDNQACLSVTNHPNNSTKSRHIALREFRIRDYHELGIIRPYWCPGNYAHEAYHLSHGFCQ